MISLKSDHEAQEHECAQVSFQEPLLASPVAQTAMAIDLQGQGPTSSSHREAGSCRPKSSSLRKPLHLFSSSWIPSKVHCTASKTNSCSCCSTTAGAPAKLATPMSVTHAFPAAHCSRLQPRPAHRTNTAAHTNTLRVCCCQAVTVDHQRLSPNPGNASEVRLLMPNFTPCIQQLKPSVLRSIPQLLTCIYFRFKANQLDKSKVLDVSLHVREGLRMPKYYHARAEVHILL